MKGVVVTVGSETVKGVSTIGSRSPILSVIFQLPWHAACEQGFSGISSRANGPLRSNHGFTSKRFGKSNLRTVGLRVGDSKDGFPRKAPPLGPAARTRGAMRSLGTAGRLARAGGSLTHFFLGRPARFAFGQPAFQK